MVLVLLGALALLAAPIGAKQVVIVDRLPKNASGKILKRELRDAQASAPLR